MIDSSPVIILQIYSQYVEVSDALQQEKDENIRLKQYLDQILKVHETQCRIEVINFLSLPQCYIYIVMYICFNLVIIEFLTINPFANKYFEIKILCSSCVDSIQFYCH